MAQRSLTPRAWKVLERLGRAMEDAGREQGDAGLVQAGADLQQRALNKDGQARKTSPGTASATGDSRL